MTRLELLQVLCRRLGKNASSLDALTQSRLLDHLALTEREVLSEPGLQHLIDTTATFASVADQYRYGLQNVSVVRRMFEATNRRTLEQMPMALYRALSPDPTQIASIPSHYVFEGYSPTQYQPSNASEIFVKSTSASDTSQTVYLEGETTGGVPRSASVTLTGATAVTLSASITTWVRVTKWYLSAVGVGTITLHEDSGSGTQLGQIGIGATSARWWSFYLYPTPSDAITYSVDVEWETTDLAQSTDVPRLPVNFHDILIDGALRLEYEKTDDTRYAFADRRFQKRLNDLRYAVASQSIGGVPGVRGSRVGAWAPVGPNYP